MQVLSDDALATIDSIAVFANGTNIALCLIAMPVVWIGLARRRRWTFWSLLAGLVTALGAGIAADYAVGFEFPHINLASGAILAMGFTLAAIGLFQRQESGAREGDN